MQIRRINRPIFEFPSSHPAREFLESFIACRRHCVGRELEGIDQQWFSHSDQCLRRFSQFAYGWLAFDIELDGWLHTPRSATSSERESLQGISRMHTLMQECRMDALSDRNEAVVAMCDEVLEMLYRGRRSIEFRLAQLQHGPE